MLENKLKILSDIYSRSTSLIAITDCEYNILWTNNEKLISSVENQSLRQCIKFNLNKNKTDVDFATATINKRSFTLNIMPIYENDAQEGNLLTFTSLKDILKYQLNKEYSESMVEYFSNVRTQVSGIISSATMIYDSLERLELYDELRLLNCQINYCYKILASIMNNTEMSKYSFGLHNIVKVNASVFLSEIMSIINSLLRGTNIDITFAYDKNVQIDVDIDRFLILILNALTNSIKFNYEEQKRIKITLKKTGEYATLNFADNGVGMSPASLASYLEEENLSTINFADTHKSTGLGHSIFSYFCKTFGATMYLSSKENIGTTVSFKMPLSTDDEVPKYMESKTSDYLSNRFSNVYIAISQVAQINYF